METVMAGKQNSTTGNTKAIDVPEHVRQAAETSITQAKQAIDQCLRQATNLQEKVETSAQSVQAGARAMNQTVLAAAEANINASFDFAQQLVRAKDPQEIVTLQQKFLQQQLARLQDQMEQMGSTARRTTEEASAGAGPKG
jgi:phasin